MIANIFYYGVVLIAGFPSLRSVAVLRKEAIELSLLRRLASEYFHVFGDPLHANSDIFARLHRNIPDLDKINRVRMHVGRDIRVTEAKQHAFDGLQADAVRLLNFGKNGGGLQGPAS